MRRLAVVALIVAVTAVTASTAVAGPMPDPFCDVCGVRFSQALEIEGHNGSLAESTVTVHVRANGTAAWTVRNRLANDSTAEWARENPQRLDAVVASALSDGPSRTVDHASAIETDVSEDGEVRIDFRTSDGVSTRPGGIVLVEFLHKHGRGAGWAVAADQFTVIGPPGTTVTNEPGERVAARRMSTDGRRVTFAGSHRGYYPVISADVYVAFGPDDGTATGVATRAAMTAASAPPIAERFGALYGPGLVVLVLAMVGIHGSRTGRESGLSTRRFYLWVAGFAIVYVGATVTFLPPTRSYQFAGLFTVLFVGAAIAVAVVAGIVYRIAERPA